MRNKGLNNNLTDTISKGGVLYRPGEIPVLTKEQLAQANLVSKLPHDFPFANWEGMTTKQQLQQMKYSGLNPQEQWSLLNANVPLGVLKEHNQAQEYAEAQATPVQAPALLSAKAVQSLAQNIQNANTNSSISPSLQTNGLKQKLNILKEEYKQNPLGKASGSVGASVAPKAVGNVTANVGVGIINKEELKSDSKPSSTPLMIAFETEPPTKTPRVTPTPSPTPLPHPGPSPVIDERKITLLNRLKQKVNGDLNLLERVKGFNTTGSALGVVFDNEQTLERMASRYDVPKPVLQTIMFREQRFVDIRDTAADFLTEFGLRKQSSTGLMQVTTRTAIDAINYTIQKGYTTYKDLGINRDTPLTYEDKGDRSSVWNLLKNDPDFNIEVATQIVRMEADEMNGSKSITGYNSSELIKLFAVYNGSGAAALEYGTECYNWYQDFSWYN